MSIELPNLPYAHDALKPFISAVTLKTHHGKHHRGYVDKLNGLLRDTEFADSTLEVVIQRFARRSAANKKAAAIFNNAAQAWNHAFYWQSLRAPGGRAPEGALAASSRRGSAASAASATPSSRRRRATSAAAGRGWWQTAPSCRS